MSVSCTKTNSLDEAFSRFSRSSRFSRFFRVFLSRALSLSRDRFRRRDAESTRAITRIISSFKDSFVYWVISCWTYSNCEDSRSVESAKVCFLLIDCSLLIRFSTFIDLSLIRTTFEFWTWSKRSMLIFVFSNLQWKWISSRRRHFENSKSRCWITWAQSNSRDVVKILMHAERTINWLVNRLLSRVWPRDEEHI
jgi:FlaA1/EpsC-like NDP-sugar epimerase